MNRISCVSKVLAPFVALAGAVATPAGAERVDVSFAGNFGGTAGMGDSFTGSFWYDSEQPMDTGGNTYPIYSGAVHDFTLSGLTFGCWSGEGAECVTALQGDLSSYATVLPQYSSVSGVTAPDISFWITGQPNAWAPGGDILIIDYRLPDEFSGTALTDVLATAPGTDVDLSRVGIGYWYNGGGGYGAQVTSFTLTRPEAPAGAVPEPATWAMMIGGFGLVGGVMRRRNRVAVA